MLIVDMLLAGQSRHPSFGRCIDAAQSILLLISLDWLQEKSASAFCMMGMLSLLSSDKFLAHKMFCICKFLHRALLKRACTERAHCREFLLSRANKNSAKKRHSEPGEINVTFGKDYVAALARRGALVVWCRITNLIQEFN